MDKALYNLMFYSEHTWGFSSSIIEPWHPQVNTLDQRKNMYAGLAHEHTSRCIDQLCASLGETEVQLNKDYRFKVINPHNIAVKDIARIDLEILFGHKHFDIIDEQSKATIPYQLASVARGYEFNLMVELGPKETRVFRLIEKDAPKLISSGMYAHDGSDHVADFYAPHNDHHPLRVSPYKLEIPFIKIEFTVDQGITSIIDKTTSKELIQPNREYNPLTPIYEMTPFEHDPCEQRRIMGRNRKDMHTKRSAGKLTNVTVLDHGDVFAKVKLSYALEGTTFCDIILTGYQHLPKIDIELRFNKSSVWEPENLYLALPFTTGENEEIWIDKSGTLMRPRIDQLPGSCVDFYSVQNGIAYIGEDTSILITMPDTPLISMGTIMAHPIKLAKEKDVNNSDYIYSWVMNNFWETNFKASLSGFHQYNYSLILSTHTDPDTCFALEKATNCSLLSFYMFG